MRPTQARGTARFGVLLASPINLTTQSPNRSGTTCSLVNHHEAAGLIVKVQFRQSGPDGRQFAPCRDILRLGIPRFLRQCRPAGLPWPEKDDTGLDIQGLFERSLDGTHDQTLHIFHLMEDLQGTLKKRVVHSATGKGTRTGPANVLKRPRMKMIRRPRSAPVP